MFFLRGGGGRGGGGGGGAGGGGGGDQILERTKRTLVPPPTPDAIPESARRFIAGLIRAPPPTPHPHPHPAPTSSTVTSPAAPAPIRVSFLFVFFSFCGASSKSKKNQSELGPELFRASRGFCLMGPFFFATRLPVARLPSFLFGFFTEFFFCAQNEQWLPERDVRKWHLKKRRKTR